MNIKLNIHPLNSQIEKEVLNKLNFKPPESYAPINNNILDTLYDKIIKKYPSETHNFYKQIILSIRANYMRNHMMLTHKKLLENEKEIIKDYNNNYDIIELVKKYDGSPLNILRIIFKEKYNEKLTNIIKKSEKINSRDKTQLLKAIENDAYALVNQDKILEDSINFENKISLILKNMNIKFKTQEELSKEQIKNTTFPTNTPDFLILDDLYINKIKINWIDAKNFYGSNLNIVKSKILKQTKKYINTWGTGAIIFNLSFNSNLKFNDILLIDYDSFYNYQQ